MIIDEDDYFMHYGTPRHSGRYPWGSGGENASTHRNPTLLDDIKSLRDKGMSDTAIAKAMGMTVAELRARKTIAINQRKRDDIHQAQKLRDKGWGPSEIAKYMHKPESTVRTLLQPGAKDKADQLLATSDMLRSALDHHDYVQIGKGVENQLGMARSKLDSAVEVLKAEGYTVHSIQVDQSIGGNKSTVKVLAPPGTQYKDVVANKDKIGLINSFTEDGGRSFLGIKPPLSVDSSRIKVRYGEEGGGDADGVIYLRPGVDDISLGGSRYAQVRIAVDGTHYLKGMAMYKDDLPQGVDLVFNTPKTDTGNKLDAMKPLKVNKETGEIDMDNPFGAIIRQRINPETGEVTSALNIVGKKEGSGEEGGWEIWSKSLSSQVLSKQNPKLAKNQLDETYATKKQEFDEIMELTNPVVRRKLLESYAEDVDSSAVHLKAAALPGQRTHVLLPINEMKENEIYAPNYENGTRVALIRYPHGGVFEIPELTVNNKNPAARKLLGDKAANASDFDNDLIADAVGINHEVAKRLSGADFDGDTVLVIPNDPANPRLKTAPPLEGLKDFDPQRLYKNPEGVEFKGNKQRLMGDVSNLITDMTIMNAPHSEIERAVKHSMVVIDAEKHNLDYRKSAIDHGIAALKRKYQGGANRGASTIISRAKSEARVPKRKGTFRVDPDTGEKIWNETGKHYIDKSGKKVFYTQSSTKLAEAKDAHTLVSDNGGTVIEKVYADHSNRLKALANTARKEAVHTQNPEWDKTAKETYKNEVASLDHKLNVALKNSPLERQALLVANVVVDQRKRSNPDLETSEVKKIHSMALEEARSRLGAKKTHVEITDNEWDAIQAHAISPSKLSKILDNADMDRVKELATPRTKPMMTSAKQMRAKAMLNAGHTQAEVARALGVSLTTLKTGIK